MAGWDEALADLVRVRGLALKRYAYVLTADEQAAQDLLQDALVRVFAARRGAAAPQAVEPYVRTVMLRRYLDQYRRERRWLRILPRAAAPLAGGDETDAVIDRMDARAALRRLSPQQRACMVLRFFEDLTVSDIAGRLDIAEGTVKRHLSDATRRLNPHLTLTDGGNSDDR